MIPGIVAGQAAVGGFSFSRVALQLHCDGTNGSTSVPDASNYAHTITAVGNAQLSTAQKKFGTASMLFDGMGDYFYAADSDAWSFSDQPFTIEFFFRASSLGARAGLISQTNSAGQNFASAFLIELTTASKISAFCCYGGNNTSPIESSVLSTNTWYHVALVRYGTTLDLFLDGVSQGAISFGNVVNNSGEELYIGQNKFQSSGLTGYIDEIRILKGLAMYTANFTPPSAPFPDS